MVSILQPSIGGVSSDPQAAAATSGCMPSETRRRSDSSKAIAPPAPPRAEMTTAMLTTNDDENAAADDLENEDDTESPSSSDDDAATAAAAAAAQQPLPPFYDPHADSEDEAYLNERALTRRSGKVEDEQDQKEKEGNGSLLPSDACLSCPCCLSTLTRLSQRHERDPGVWRSVFVEEGAVSLVEGISRGKGGRRRAPVAAAAGAAATGGKKRGRVVVGVGSVVVGIGDSAPEPTSPLRLDGGGSEERRDDDDGELTRVACSSCDEVVGCLEEDGVFIFFNVIPSA